MTKTYKVYITNVAVADMELIYNCIAGQLKSPEHAFNQYNRIADKIESLQNFPERSPITGLEPEHSQKLRKLQIDNYVILYVCRESDVMVLRVLYGASDIPNKL